MKKRILISGVMLMALSFAMGCGSKENFGGKESSTYNTVKTATKSPTVIVTQTQAPVITEEATVTVAPTNTPAVKKESKKETQTPKATRKPIKLETVKPVKTASPTMKAKKKTTTNTKKKETTAPTKKPVVKKTATPKPKKTAVPKPKKTESPTPKPEKKSVKNIKSMKEVLTTISLYMAEGQTYDSNDEECYYEVMYMLANNVGYKCGKSQYKEADGTLYIGKKAMQALSAAAFADHTMIGKIPADYADMIGFDKEMQVYTAYESDAGDVSGRIKKAVDNGNGTYTVSFELLTGDGNEVLSSYEYTLIENQSKYSKIAPNFYYRVKAVKKLTE